MNDKNQDYFNVLRKLQNNPNSTQRQLASQLGISLGKINYCINALKNKGLVKISNFKKNPNKIGYIYVSPRTVNKTQLTLNFMKKMKSMMNLKKK